MRNILPAVLIGALGWMAGASGTGAVTKQTAAPIHEVYAVRFATLPAFRVSSLVAGADRTRTLDIAMMVWAVKTPDGQWVLVDAGFSREKFLTQWKPAGYQRPTDAVAAAFGIRPDAISDVIVTHVHWDHADGVDLFPSARVWIQRDEYTHHVGDNGAVLDRAIDRDVATMLFGLNAAGRVRLVDGDDREIRPGIRVFTGGRHTVASQYVPVATRSGAVVLAADNAYLYEKLEGRRAIAQTLDAASNLVAQARMLTIAGDVARVVPGHDPSVFERDPTVKPGVVRID